LSKRKIIVFAPHPDDETLGCGGTIARKLSEGYEVLIVVLTDGRYAFLALLDIDSEPTPYELKEIRKGETKAATRILGVPEENLLFLDFEDGTLEKHAKEAEGRISEITEKYVPAEIYLPHIRDWHPDHRETNRIARKCLQKLGSKPTKFQYSISHKYGRIGPLMERVFSFFTRNRKEVDISEFLSLKERAVNEFKTEVSIISSKQEEPVEKDVNKYLKNRETFYVNR